MVGYPGLGTHCAVVGAELGSVLLDHAIRLLRGFLALEGQHPVTVLQLCSDVVECVPCPTRMQHLCSRQSVARQRRSLQLVARQRWSLQSYGHCSSFRVRSARHIVLLNCAMETGFALFALEYGVMEIQISKQ